MQCHLTRGRNSSKNWLAKKGRIFIQPN
jgi:hypothetical protein